MYRRRAGHLEVLLAHPGGPYWLNKDAGAWTIPKGLVDEGEDLLESAKREFEEETGFPPNGEFIPLGQIKQKAGKIVHAWAFEGDLDPSAIKSNTYREQWPPKSGQWKTFPEIDRADFFSIDRGKEKINQAQAEFLSRLEALVQRKIPRGSPTE